MKPKTQTMQKHQKDEKSSLNEHNPTIPQKRNASNRSPLEGHPDKKHKETEMDQSRNNTSTNHDNSDYEEEHTSPLDTYSQHVNNSSKSPGLETAKMDTTTISDPETSESNTHEVTLSSLLSEL